MNGSRTQNRARRLAARAFRPLRAYARAFRASLAPYSSRCAWRGKGTQADLLNKHLRACHLSTDDVFRAAKGRDGCDLSPAMRAALEYMRRGDLVPDSTVWDLVRERSGCLHCGGLSSTNFLAR